MKFIQQLVPDQANRSLAPFALAFCMAAVGGAIDALGWALGIRSLAVLGFLVAAAAIGLGIVLVLVGQLLGLYRIVRKLRSGK
jgi:hypothetical protein